MGDRLRLEINFKDYENKFKMLNENDKHVFMKEFLASKRSFILLITNFSAYITLIIITLAISVYTN